MSPENTPPASRIMAIDLQRPDPDVLRRAARILRSGGVIVYPTETLYGIGADASSEVAVQKVVAVKRRTEEKPILVLVHSPGAAAPLVRNVLPAAERLIAAFWPGPLTLVFSAAAGVPAGITRGRGTIGIRVPSGLLCRRLAEEAGVPLTSTSANLSGREIPETVAQMRTALGGGVDLFLDAGVLPPSLPSTVVDVSVDPPIVLRAGALPVSRLRVVVPQLVGGG
jgi:L-threonylcarbamoyladenylate synthase